MQRQNKTRILECDNPFKITYALHTLPLKQGQITKLQAFQMRGLRNNLKLQHPYMNRANTNKTIIIKTNAALRQAHKAQSDKHKAKNKLKNTKTAVPKFKPVVTLGTFIDKQKHLHRTYHKGPPQIPTSTHDAFTK